MAITITEGCETPAKVAMSTRDGKGQNARAADIQFHRHCQKTVCSARGYNDEGATWSTLVKTDQDSELPNLPSGWIRKFSQNNENITQDLRSILELMNTLAGNVAKSWTLRFKDNNGHVICEDVIEPWASTSNIYDFTGFGRDVQLKINDEIIQFNTMTVTGGEATEITLPTHSLTIQVNGETVKDIDGIVMDSDETVNITIPEVKMDFDKIYPIGSVYISVDSSFNPNTAFQGTQWQKFGQGKCLWGANVQDNIVPDEDSVINAGLPNITGSIASKRTESSTDYYEPLMLASTDNSGALSTVKRSFNTGWASQSGDGISQITLDASKSNSIYGNSTTVQPPAIKVIFWKRTS